MSEQNYTYVIVGGGLAGASAVEGIRERDPEGTILMLGMEAELPYDRPPLSKGLWSGKKKPTEVFVHDRGFYASQRVDLVGGVAATALDAASRTVTDGRGNRYRYEKLLLAMGGMPRRLSVAGGDLEGILYYRTLGDYRSARSVAGEGKTAVVIGGGFIGSEVAAALHGVGTEVTMVFPGKAIAERVLPADLARAVTEAYRQKGVRVLAGDRPARIDRVGERFRVRTSAGIEVEADVVVAGIGIVPNTRLAEMAGLRAGDGVIVDDRLRTSDERIWAAGDVAYFPCRALGKELRVEHWDNAKTGGRCAGRNMAGADEVYDYVPYFFSDLFEFGYEAAGEVDSRLETVADWQKEFDTGVIYYLKDGVVRGVMMCNIWGKVEEARRMIRDKKRVGKGELVGAIG